MIPALLILAAALIVLAVVYAMTARQKASSMSLFQQQLSSLQEQVSQTLGESSRLIQGSQQNLGERLDNNSRLFNEVSERLVKLEETNKQIQSVGKEIANLQQVLQAPKLRGNLGELFLEELLAQILPTAYYEMQYAFRGGERVDAIIRLADGHIVSVDAKFPLENFTRMTASGLTEAEKKQFRKAFLADVKKHIDDIAKKYIRPDENTLDFALLYIPAENVYYEAILKEEFGVENINSYALKMRVVPVSPNSFYAFLQAIILGLRGLKIEERAKEILIFLGKLRGDFERLREDVGMANKHFLSGTNSLEKSTKRLGKIHDQLQTIDQPLATVTGEASATDPRPAYLAEVQNE